MRFLTAYPSLSANVICESSLIVIAISIYRQGSCYDAKNSNGLSFRKIFRNNKFVKNERTICYFIHKGFQTIVRTGNSSGHIWRGAACGCICYLRPRHLTKKKVLKMLELSNFLSIYAYIFWFLTFVVWNIEFDELDLSWFELDSYRLHRQ